MKTDGLFVVVLLSCVCEETLLYQVRGIRMCQEKCLTTGQCVSLLYTPHNLFCFWNTDAAINTQLSTAFPNSITQSKAWICDRTEDRKFINLCSNKCPLQYRILHTRMKRDQCAKYEGRCLSPPPHVRNARITSGLKAKVADYDCTYQFAMFGLKTIFCLEGKWLGSPGKCYRISYRHTHLNIFQATPNSLEKVSSSLPYPWPLKRGLFFFKVFPSSTNNWTTQFSCDTGEYIGFINIGHEICCHQSTRTWNSQECTTLQTSKGNMALFNVHVNAKYCLNGTCEDFVLITASKDYKTKCSIWTETSCMHRIVIKGDVAIKAVWFSPPDVM